MSCVGPCVGFSALSSCPECTCSFKFSVSFIFFPQFFLSSWLALKFTPLLIPSPLRPRSLLRSKLDPAFIKHVLERLTSISSWRLMDLGRLPPSNASGKKEIWCVCPWFPFPCLINPCCSRFAPVVRRTRRSVRLGCADLALRAASPSISVTSRTFTLPSISWTSSL